MTAADGNVWGTVAWMIVFMLVGAPFVYLVWEFINEVLTGRFDALTFGLAVLGAVGLTAVLRLVGRRAASWADEP